MVSLKTFHVITLHTNSNRTLKKNAFKPHLTALLAFAGCSLTVKILETSSSLSLSYLEDLSLDFAEYHEKFCCLVYPQVT